MRASAESTRRSVSSIRLPDGARVLDVGIGTGAALARCSDLVRAKGLHIVGLDIDPDTADAVRDALGLTRAMMDGDEAGADAILHALGDDGDPAVEVCRVTAGLLADLMGKCGVQPEWIASFQQRAGL